MIRRHFLILIVIIFLVSCSSKEPVKINYDLEDSVVGYFYYDKVLYRLDKVVREDDGSLGREITTIKRIVSELQEEGDLYYPELYEDRNIQVGNKVYLLSGNIDPQVALAIETDKGDYLIAQIVIKNPEFIND